MAKIKARKVATPGSKPTGLGISPGRGRPKKAKLTVGTSRKGNYRTKYTMERMNAAINAVRDKTMHLREAAKHFQVNPLLVINCKPPTPPTPTLIVSV
jgi:hypothetical protein